MAATTTQRHCWRVESLSIAVHSSSKGQRARRKVAPFVSIRVAGSSNRLESGSRRLESRLNPLELCLIRLDNRLNRLDNRLNRLDNRLNRLENRLNRLENRLLRLETRVNRPARGSNSFEECLHAFAGRAKNLEGQPNLPE